MLNFNHVYYFHVAASEGSVKGAADRLGLTQPTVSEQIKMLERSLGVTLFERTGTGLRLTDPGRDAFEHTTTMFRAGERLLGVLGRVGETQPIALRVGVAVGIGRSVAADFLMPVMTMRECRPVVRAGDPLDLMRDLRARELDVLITDTPPVDLAGRNHETVVLHHPRLIAIAGLDVEPSADWDNVSMLEHRASSTYRWDVDAFLQQRALRPRGVAELDDAFLMLEAVARGGLVAVVPRSVARDAIAVNRVKVLAELEPGSSAIYAVYHRADEVDLSRRVVDLLVEHARSKFDA